MKFSASVTFKCQRAEASGLRNFKEMRKLLRHMVARGKGENELTLTELLAVVGMVVALATVIGHFRYHIFF